MIDPDAIPADLVITISDVRRAGYCPSGTRRWFEVHDLDFKAFVQPGGGIPAREFAVIDAHAEAVVAATLGIVVDG